MTIPWSNSINCCYLGYADARLVYDIGDPAKPQWVGAMEAGCDAAALEGDYVYQDTIAGIYVADVSKPSHPVYVSSMGTARGLDDSVQSIVVKDSVLYVLGMYNGLYVYDVSTPTSPRKIGAFDIVPRFGLDFSLAMATRFSRSTGTEACW